MTSDEQLIAQLGLWADELAETATPFTATDLGQPVVVPLTARRRRPDALWWGLAAAAAVVAVVAWRTWADGSRQIVPADTTIATVPVTVPAPSTTDAPTSTDEPTATAATTSSEAPTTTDPTPTDPTTVAPVLTQPAIIIDGEFLGLSVNSLRSESQAALEQFGLPITAEANPGAHLCGVGLPYSVVTTVGGLSVQWEGNSDADARITNWWYSGHDIDGHPQMETAEGITVGSTQSEVAGAYPGAEVGADTEVFLTGYRIELTAGVVTGIGEVNCGD